MPGRAGNRGKSMTIGVCGMFDESKTVAPTVFGRPEIGGNGKRLCKYLRIKDLHGRQSEMP